MSMKVCILNYGSGNVKSVYNIIKALTDDVIVSNDPDEIRNAEKLVLPGVGAYGTSMTKIKKTIPLDVVEGEVAIKKKPILGICVGMQVLFTTGYEFGKHDGLGWIKGVVKVLDVEGLTLPHIGWNEIDVTKQNLLYAQNEKAGNDFYFVHSYACFPEDPDCVIATCDYGKEFCSAVQHENIFGVQFHPEKSQIAGKKLLKNFIDLDYEKK